MKRTLQDQYLLIKEGKGHKDVFMKEAKTQFPGLIRNAATFNEIATVLKDKNIINENIVGLEPINQLPGTKKESFETAFENFLKEAKDTYFEDEKAEVKKTSKQVEDDLSHNFDRADKSNPDNMIFDQIMKGYYTEMKDPKNADKTMEQLKAIVLKNLEKNPIYYTEKGQFGVKDLGYTTETPGLGTPKEPKGPHKSSGYGSLSEGIKRNYPNFIDSEYQGEEERLEGDELYTYLVDTMAISRGEDDFIRKITYGLTDETSSLSPEDVQKLRTWYQENLGEKIKADLGKGFVKESLEEQKYEVKYSESNDTYQVWLDDELITDFSTEEYANSEAKRLNDLLDIKRINKAQEPINEEDQIRKVIRESIEKELAAINKEAELEVLDSKLEKIEAAIEKRNAQLSKLDEDEDMKALTDKKKIKSLEKDIKTLEKAKAKIEKQLSKVAKKNKGANVAKKEVIDEDEVLNEIDPKGTEAARDASKEMDDNFKSIKSTVDSIELEEDENGVPQSIINQVVDKYADTGGDNSKIEIIASEFPEYEKEIIEFLEGYDLGLDYDI